MSVCESRVCNVKIRLKDSEITNLRCDCPYAYDGNNCKHMAAVLFCSDDAGPINKEQSKNTQENLANLVIEADVTVVREFLTSILINDKKLLNRFKSILKYEFPSKDIARYKNQMNEIFNRHSG